MKERALCEQLKRKNFITPISEHNGFQSQGSIKENAQDVLDVKVKQGRRRCCLPNCKVSVLHKSALQVKEAATSSLMAVGCGHALEKYVITSISKQLIVT